jgi:hypothetical protein
LADKVQAQSADGASLDGKVEIGPWRLSRVEGVTIVLHSKDDAGRFHAEDDADLMLAGIAVRVLEEIGADLLQSETGGVGDLGIHPGPVKKGFCPRRQADQGVQAVGNALSKFRVHQGCATDLLVMESGRPRPAFRDEGVAAPKEESREGR